MMKKKNRHKKTVKQKVPSLKLKLSLIGFSALLIVVAFLGGIFLTSGAHNYYTISGMDELLRSSGIEKTFVRSMEKLDLNFLENRVKEVLANYPVQVLYFIKTGASSVFWSSEKKEKINEKDIISLCKGRNNSKNSRYFVDVESQGFYFVKHSESYILIAKLKPFPKPLLGGLFETQQIRFRVIFKQFSGQLISLLLVLFSLSILVVYFIIYYLVVTPVKLFIALIDGGKSGGGAKSLGILSGGREHLCELINMQSDKVSVKESNRQIPFLPKRSGYDFKGLNAGGFFLECNEITKEHCDLFPISENVYGLFLGEVAGRADENELAVAKVFWLCQSMSFSYKNPALVINELNRFLFLTGFGRAVNIFIGFLNVEEGSLTFSQAGGMPLYKFSASGKDNRYHLDTPPAGLIDPDAFKAVVSYAKLSLFKGDVVSLFTDGIMKIDGFDWEKEIEQIFSASETLGGKIMKLKSRLDEVNISSKSRDDIATLFVEI